MGKLPKNGFCYISVNKILKMTSQYNTSLGILRDYFFPGIFRKFTVCFVNVFTPRQYCKSSVLSYSRECSSVQKRDISTLCHPLYLRLGATKMHWYHHVLQLHRFRLHCSLLQISIDTKLTQLVVMSCLQALFPALHLLTALFSFHQNDVKVSHVWTVGL